MHDPDVRLTDEEQRRLEALDAALSADDPHLARRMRRAHRNRVMDVLLNMRLPSQRVVGAVCALLGAVVVVVSFTRSVAVAFGGSVLLATGIYLLCTAVWHWRAPGTSGS
jgi:sulfite exporter TauE/SafE